VDAIYHSDSLYSAVTAAMARLGWLEEWLDATARNGSSAVSFSSCFPYMDEIGFVVPPRTIWPPVSPSAKAARVRWKSARFVPLTVVESILAGRRLDENQWSIDGPSGCLVPADRPGPFRTAVRWSAAVDRLTGSSDRHSTACLEFRPGSGLWTVVSFQDEAAAESWSARMKAAFRLLADTGFGGERSRGWGRSEAPEFLDGVLPDLILPAPPVAPPTAAPQPLPTPTPETSLTPPPSEVLEASVEAASPVLSLAVKTEPEPIEPQPEPTGELAPEEVLATAAPVPEPAASQPETAAVPPEPTAGEPLPAEAPVPDPGASQPETLAVPPEPTAGEPVPAEVPVPEPAVSLPEAAAVPPEPTAGEPAPEEAAPVPEPAVSLPETAAVPPEPTAGEPLPVAAFVPEPAVSLPEAAAVLPEPTTGEPAPEEALLPEPGASQPEAAAVPPEPTAGEPLPDEAPVPEPAAPQPETAAAPPEPTAGEPAPTPETAAGEPLPEVVPAAVTEPPAEGAEQAALEPVPAAEMAGPRPEAATAAVPEIPAAPAAPAAPTHPHWLLSVFTPADTDTVDWRRGNYTVLARGGRVDSPAGSGELKKQIQMVAEGSVVYAETAPRGSAANVAPDGFAHPVFRAGFALAIPLPEVS
jgi:CRISPR/Cas system CSM-associated protein Csm4 (group 5 of RAMP superfamily)